jgi:dienelactone hydrolase
MIAGFLSLLGFLLVAVASSAEAQAIDWTLNEQVEMIPLDSGLWSVELETTIFKPPGAGPFPLAVVNHGKAIGDPKFDPRARFVSLTRELLKMGYVVAIPMRPGFSKSTGTLVNSRCNMKSAGDVQADVIVQFIAKFRSRPYVDGSNILVIGQSYGGLTAMALASRKIEGMKGVVNFAGGLKWESPNAPCNWQGTLVEAFESYGKEAKVPSIWFYGDNDSYWGSELPKTLYAAYGKAGGKAELVSYGTWPYGDAHGMVTSYKSLSIWLEPTRKFMESVGLPAQPKFAIDVYPRPPKTSYASIDHLDAIPYIRAESRNAYQRFLESAKPRAFAISKNGTYAWASEGPDPLAVAIVNCRERAKAPCELYAVDDDVVWAQH